jgi:broad specificity phosphatase PhoE
MAFDPHGYARQAKPPAAKILLMRHPHTVANQNLRFSGSQNLPLSELGKQQLPRAIAGLVAWEPSTIVSSPLQRCLAIAVPAAEQLGLEVEVDPRIAEMDFGVIEGLTHEEILERGLCMPWGETASRWPVEQAESIEQFAERLVAAASDLEKRSGKTAVIAHGGVIRGISSHWLQIPLTKLWNMTVRNIESSLYKNDTDDGIFLERFGLRPEWLKDNL